jgi:hypothetical protein
MATSKVLPGFRRLPGRSERFINEATGEEISRRKYDTIRRGLSNEQLRDINRAQNPEISLARPARGRTSAIKLAPEIRADIAAARREAEEQRKQREKQIKETAKLQRKIESAKNKKVRRKKVRKQLLKPGQMGSRIAFNDYDEYTEALDEARKTGVVFAYGLGWHGIDERTGRTLDVTVFTLTSVRTTYDEDEFETAFEESQESKSYMIFLNYFMHIAFSKSFAEELAEKNGKGKRKSTMDQFRNGKKKN